MRWSRRGGCGAGSSSSGSWHGNPVPPSGVHQIALYARHGIPEVWLCDVKAGELAVYHEPIEGQYRRMHKPTNCETVAPLWMPGVWVALTDVLA